MRRQLEAVKLCQVNSITLTSSGEPNAMENDGKAFEDTVRFERKNKIMPLDPFYSRHHSTDRLNKLNPNQKVFYSPHSTMPRNFMQQPPLMMMGAAGRQRGSMELKAKKSVWLKIRQSFSRVKPRIKLNDAYINESIISE